MITSLANQQIKQILKLQKSAAYRRKQGLFIVEGIRMFKEVPRHLAKQVLVTEECYEGHSKLFEGLPFELVSSKVYKAISDTMAPQGILVVAKQLSYTWEQVTAGEKPALILLEHLQDPGNLGTIIRMAEGAGITGIILSKDTVDIYNSKVIRSTMGSVFRVPFLYVEDVIKSAELLNQQGICTYAAHLQGEELYSYDYTKGSCVFIGNEGNGLSDGLTKEARYKLRIPMEGKVESLNAATAATIISYEMLRQRRYCH